MKKGLLAILTLFLLSSCNQNIINYLNPRAKFRSFESYSVVNVKINKRQLEAEATELLGHIEDQIKVQMEQRRQYVPSNVDPDLILRYELVSNSRADNRNNNSIYDPTPRFNSRIFYESVILLELFDGKTLVWQGSYDLNQSRKNERNAKTIKKAIDLIFTTYPYKAGSAQPDPSLTSYKNK